MEQIALHTWRDHLFTHLNEKVANAALRMLERSRSGEPINSDAIRAVVESYIELGILESESDLDNTIAHLTVGFIKLNRDKTLDIQYTYSNKGVQRV